jgi:hypothetical protein
MNKDAIDSFSHSLNGLPNLILNTSLALILPEIRED